MTKSVARLSLLGVLLVAIATPALAHRANPVGSSKAATMMVIGVSAPTLVADGFPIPWPKPTTTTEPPANAAELPALMADGPNPIPWPKTDTTSKPPASATGLPMLMADGPNPIPWPKTDTTSKPPASAVA